MDDNILRGSIIEKKHNRQWGAYSLMYAVKKIYLNVKFALRVCQDPVVTSVV